MWRPSLVSKRSSPSPPLLCEVSPSEQKSEPSPRRNPPPSPRSTLTEALKNNPFKAPHGLIPPQTHISVLVNDDPVTSLNSDLKRFAHIYPDVKIEVLRELLLRFDGDSRLPICTEQLIKFKSEWTRGRLLNPPRDADADVPVDETFRSKNYIAATKHTLYAEFRSLNRSAVDAVLAEVNQSYTKARPVLQELAAKSWRATISSLFKRRKAVDEPPAFLVEKYHLKQSLHSTGDRELDNELEQLFLVAQRKHRQTIQEQADRVIALNLNQQEAEEAEALFECQVCYNDVPFESIITCTTDAHTICCDCIKHSLTEAIFGQGWAKAINAGYGTLCCVASDSHGECQGHVPVGLLRNTILSSEAGVETWAKFEQRLATDSIMKSGLQLTQCPFCHYGEASHAHTLETAYAIKWHLRGHSATAETMLLALLVMALFPIFLLVVAVVSLIAPAKPRAVFNTSLNNLHAQLQTQRFRCKNTQCGRTSCLSCSKSWHDPHTCHEPLIISLRTAVEAARTAALKRTCPRCGTSFVKSSGCNKLTCVCGYAMCYVCRKNIGRVNTAGAVDDRDGGEGYRHFCEHFRPIAGQKCAECDKCDLYKSEDEELVVKRAGEEAEREWREREGMVGVKSLKLERAVTNLGKLGKDDEMTIAWNKFLAGDWSVQDVCDWSMGKIIVIEN